MKSTFSFSQTATCLQLSAPVHTVLTPGCPQVLFDTPHATLGRRTRDRLVLQILASSELAPWPDVASFVHSLLKAIDQLEWESWPVLEGLRVVNFFSRGYPDQQQPGAVSEADPRTCGGHYHNSTTPITRLDCEIGHVLKLRGDEPAADAIVKSIKKCLPNSPSGEIYKLPPPWMRIRVSHSRNRATRCPHAASPSHVGCSTRRVSRA